MLNALRLLNQRKNVVVYVAPAKEFRELKSLAQWGEFISGCDGDLRHKVEQRAASEQNSLPMAPPRARSPRIHGQHP